MNDNTYWGSLIGLVSELKQCDEGGMITASIALAFICIDTFSNLARPTNKSRGTRSDFIEWVDQYLEEHPDQPYKYRGKDVYAARCAFLHTYGSEAQLHEKDSNIIKFGYYDGGEHKYNVDIDPTKAIIGTRSFINDVVNASKSFLEACKNDSLLRKRVELRLPNVLQTFPLTKSEDDEQ